MISNKIQQTQTLKLNISNNLVQSLKILNMGRQELEEELENFSLSNPVLDVEIKIQSTGRNTLKTKEGLLVTIGMNLPIKMTQTMILRI